MTRKPPPALPPSLPDFPSESERLEHLIRACADASLPWMTAHALERKAPRFGLGFDDTPLSAAVRSGSLDALRLVLRLELADPHALDRRGRHPLILAAMLGRSAMVDDLVKACPRPPFDRLGHGPLHAAAASNQAQCAQALLSHFSPQELDAGGFDPLSRACLENAPDCARLLAPISNLQNRDPRHGLSALEWAARKGHGQCAALLAPFCPPSILSQALRIAAQEPEGFERFESSLGQGRAIALAAIERALLDPGAAPSRARLRV